MTARHDRAPVIVLLAAGASRRFGGIKQLADIDGETMVHRVARTALTTGAKVIVVTGAHAEKISAALADLPLLITRHAAWSEGMGSSLAAGIRHAQAHFPSATGALLCLADQPLLDGASLRQMLDRHAEMPAHILATKHNGVAGPPILFSSDCFAELARWSGAQGAKAVLKREAHRVEHLAHDRCIDVDTEDDLKRLQQRFAEIREIELAREL